MATPPRRSAAPGKNSTPATKRERVDWPAVERDYRTGKFTDQELAEKHGNLVSRQAVTKMAKAKGWTRDLTRAIRHATNASLVAEVAKQKVAEQVAKGCAATADTVLIAAEANKQIILGHRTDIRQARDVASALLGELANAALLAEHSELLSEIVAGEGAEPVDVSKARAAVYKALSIGGRITGIKALAETFTKLQDAERRAHNITEEPEGDSSSDTLADFLSNLAQRGSRLPTKGGE